jgi:putative DNA primase/helicase
MDQNDRALIVELSNLDLMEYERSRRTAAQRLGVRETVLDQLVRQEAKKRAAEPGEFSSSVEPWRKEVDGAELLDRITTKFERYLVLRPGEANCCAFWSVFTHAHDAFDISPRLKLESPEPDCGKTTLLDVLYYIVPNPLMTANLTAASLFRRLDYCRTTVLIDEWEMGARDLVQVLNSGHRRDRSVVMRADGPGREPRTFRIYAPVAIAGLKGLPATLVSRSIAIRLRRRRHDEKIADFDHDRDGKLHRLCRMAARWAIDNRHALREATPEVPPSLQNRARDNFRPFLAIAEVAGGEWPTQARRAAELLSARTSSTQSIGAMLLFDIRLLFTRNKLDRIASADLTSRLARMEGRPWAEFKGRGAISQNGIANLLAPYDIGPRDLRFGMQVLKGYRADDFEEAWARYLPPAK